ncbi:MAG: endopeptidase La [Acidimicrobiales bacterium]
MTTRSPEDLSPDADLDNTELDRPELDSPELDRPEVLTLPVMPLPDGVVLPDMVVTIALQSDEALDAAAATVDERLLLVPRLDAPNGGHRYARIGVLATIEDRGALPNGVPALTIRSHQRVRIGTGIIGTTGGLWVEAETLDDTTTADAEVLTDLVTEYRAAASNLLDRVGGKRMAGALRGITDPGTLADSVGYWPDLALDQRVQLLETVDVAERLRLATSIVKQALAEIEVRNRINNEVSEDLDKAQRDAILRRQLAAIRSELGETDDSSGTDYRAQLEELVANGHVADKVAEAIAFEIAKLERSGGESTEANWIRTWLDTVFDLPWASRSVEHLDLGAARSILDADHTGLDDVKDRLIEYLAVRKLRADRADARAAAAEGAASNDDESAAARPDPRRPGGVILSLVGPPGVGKTSLGSSIARALDREFVRLALGGVHDEAEIRGHRRTYVGARPGRLVRALTEAGTMNPVVLLDEVDKVGSDHRGDPSAALLEVLDPAQNHSFRDHYLEFELDLSDVVFIATANVLDTIPGPLLDRMEIISIEGYTESEKAAIASDHLIPRLVESNGLDAGEVTFTEAAIRQIAGDYTREAGVRQLERLLDKALRKSATTIATRDADEVGHEPADGSGPITVDVDDLHDLLGRPPIQEKAVDRIDRPGIATGLAVTGAGGDVLFVEAALVPGNGEPVLTGQLGDVMKESASLARSLASVRAPAFGAEFPDDRRLHVHFPAGAVPKDGPSAGITMTTALMSLLLDRPVRGDVAMTGEVTLQGRVLPIGGVKQKVLAAHRAGIRTVILPVANGPDLDEVPSEVREALDIHLATTIDDVLEVALTPVAVA